MPLSGPAASHKMRVVLSGVSARTGEQVDLREPPARGRPAKRGRGDGPRELVRWLRPGEYVPVPAKKVPVRVVKYDTKLREASLRAVQAVHAMLTRVVLFECNECKERFPAFHPAYAPPPELAETMEVLRRGRDGCAPCNMEVFAWDEGSWPRRPGQEEPTGAVAEQCSGTCRRCRMDMVRQAEAGAPEQGGLVVAASLRSEENHMDPCLNFPWDDLKWLFDQATATEAMLLALEHMQVQFVRVARSGFSKFRRNTISFPQDLDVFAQTHELMKNYRVGDRVNSARGLLAGDPQDPDREAVSAAAATAEDRARYATDAGGRLIIPGVIVDIAPDGRLLVEYGQGGGRGLERPENVTPRVHMPWHPRRLPLHLMLRRNVGGKRGVLEGLKVRWHLVANVLQALCRYAENGSPWRVGGTVLEPMHKYYDPRRFHAMEEQEMRLRYAPVEAEGELLSEREVEGMTEQERVDKTVDVETPAQFLAAGFSVQFTGPAEEGPGPRAAGSHGGAASGEGGAGENGEDGGAPKKEFGEEEGEEEEEAGADGTVVDLELFRLWLDSTEFPVGLRVQRWWAGLPAGAEGEVLPLKAEDDETVADLFQRILAELREAAEEEARASEERAAAQGSVSGLSVRDLVAWLRGRMGEEQLHGGPGVDAEAALDDVYGEIAIAATWRVLDGDTGTVREEAAGGDEEQDAVRLAERTVYGWPGTAAEPTGAYTRGRFVRAFPLEFPMGIGDLYEDPPRPRKVSVEEWVQHLLRYRTGQFVSGPRGKRVLWAMVNTLLLTEARGKGFGIYRNTIRRVGLGLEGGRIMTKGRLRGILQQEDRARILVGQLANIGRDVRSTTMQWAWESKKLQTAVKHLSWLPPWVDGRDEDGAVPVGQRFMEELEVEHQPGRVARTRGLVPDDVGLGRFPSLWWTQNTHYNRSFDVQRLNVAATWLAGDPEDRFRRARSAFVQENADLVSQIMALRVELTMRVVMPAVVPHSRRYPYLCMARFETGSGGNPHAHGFSVGLPGPRMGRVHADVDGGEADPAKGDLPPSILAEDVAVLLRWLWQGGGAAEWDAGGAVLRAAAEARVREQLEAADAEAAAAADGEGAGDEARRDPEATEDGARSLAVRARDAVSALVEEGVLQELAGEAAAERSDVRYRCVPPPPDVDLAGVVRRQLRGVRHRRVTGALPDFGVLRPEVEHVDLQSRLERQFADFFGGVVSEWNPCYDDEGRCRYHWDEEIGAHNVLESGGEAQTAEERARAVVSGAAPETVNLRAVLDAVLGPGRGPRDVDVQPLRRLVASLVQRVARHSSHGVFPPKFGVHACARGKESCPKCRYGFPRDRLPRAGARGMVMQKGDKEGQWHAQFPRNDRLCCSYEEHVLLANMGNIDWRPILNLWAVTEYVTKYAAKAPKGSRGVKEVLRDAVDKVCEYVPEGEGVDLLRRSIQKFFALQLGERDYHLYEAVPLGLQLPQVLPLMPVVSLNTGGTRAMKSHAVLRDKDDEEPVHYDSKIDKFNMRLALVRKQREDGDLSIAEAEVRDVSLFEFYWKFFVRRGKVCRSTRSVCIMVTPAYGADCANVQHAHHEGYARANVIAHWRQMSTVRRHAMIEAQTGVRAVPRLCWGGSVFQDPYDRAGSPAVAGPGRFLGVQDLWNLFGAVHGREAEIFWGLMFLEMITDPLLHQWVPAWVVEQYERANPFYKEVLTQMQLPALVTNRRLLRAVRKEMIRRHAVFLRAQGRAAAGEPGAGDGSEGGSEGDGGGSGDEDAAENLFDRLAGAEDEDPNEQERLKFIREPRPGELEDGAAAEGDEGVWARRMAEEKLSAAGPAEQAQAIVFGEGGPGAGSGGEGQGVLFNPKGYDWVNDPCNVDISEKARLEQLKAEWFGTDDVGDGAEAVDVETLDDWQRFAHDIVMDGSRRAGGPLRLMLLGGAGTGKSRTVRGFVGSRRARARRQVSGGFQIHGGGGAVYGKKEREKVRNSCLLAAPTGCASFQLQYRATTVHRAFGIPVHYCGPASKGARGSERFRRMRTRLQQAELCAVDELSMVGRAMLGKMEFKVRDLLKGSLDNVPAEGPGQYMANKDMVLSGDFKQAPPIGDDPMYRMGAYRGKGQNKPRGAATTPTEAWTTERLSTVGSHVRDTFEDVALLRKVHRYDETRPGVTDPGKLAECRREAARFLEVTRGMADCTWTKEDHAWLEKRNRTLLQQTREGLEELKTFEDAPLLMDGRKDRVTGEVGAIRINQLRLERLSAKTQKPIAVLEAFHDVAEESPEAGQGRGGRRPKRPVLSVKKPEALDAEDFRGVENEVLVCEGARVLLTQNLWVEAGLMNGAIGKVVGYMWPTGANPHDPDRKDLRCPVCVFVEFEKVNMQDEEGRPRSFFPDDPARKNWVPIWRQDAACTAEDNVKRSNFPLTLAWALTHWKAQGMTLDKVRVHLTERTAAAAGIGFVATTRVRHPWDLVFEEDLPEYEAFMKARRTRAFRERRRYELRCSARASRTLRRYGYCRGDAWTAEESGAAEKLLRGLAEVGSERRRSLAGARRAVDDDTWVWGDAEPDYAGELARQVERVAGGGAEGRLLLERVAQRLLDRARVRVLRPDEVGEAEALLGAVPEEVRERGREGPGCREALCAAAEERAGADAERREQLLELARGVARRLEWAGVFDGQVVEGVPESIRPLHMSAVKEALRALIPENLHGSLDKAVAAQKDKGGAGVVSSYLCMDQWQVSVRAEDLLNRGRLGEDMLEFMLLVVRRICEELGLKIAVVSKTVGKEVGMQESPGKLGKVLGKWKKVWNWDRVRRATELLLPVAVDERAQDWMLVEVRSAVEGESLEDAKQLRVCVHDEAERKDLAERIARNVDTLLRGVSSRLGGSTPEVVFAQGVPVCRVSSQRILRAFGSLLGRVGAAAGEETLSPAGEAFVPEVSHVLRAVFARFRAGLEGRGGRDVGVLLQGSEECRAVLKALGTVPRVSLARGEPGGAAAGGVAQGGRLGPSHGERPEVGGAGGEGGGLLRVATWNIAGGKMSAQKAPGWSLEDQRAAVVAEVLRWRSAFGVDLVALQECEGPGALPELLAGDGLCFVGSAEARETRGHVHLYARRGLECSLLPLGEGAPGVAATVKLPGPGQEAARVVAVHLPSGEQAALRQRVLKDVLARVPAEDGKVLVVGDCNVRPDEVDALLSVGDLRAAWYEGATWGVSGNRFDKDVPAKGPGKKYDQALCGRAVWAEALVIAQGRQFFEGAEFHLSDHFGLMVYAAVGEEFASRRKEELRRAEKRRAAVTRLRNEARQREGEELKARRQAAVEVRAMERQRAADRGRREWDAAQRRGAAERRNRREALRVAAFGTESLFRPAQEVVPWRGCGRPVEAWAVAVPEMDGLTGGAWEDVTALPAVGMGNLGNTCYASSMSQVLLRTPAVLEWLQRHFGESGCPRRDSGLSCVACSLYSTARQCVHVGLCGVVQRPQLSQERAGVGAWYGDTEPHDAGEFLGHFIDVATAAEQAAERAAPWSPGEMDGPHGSHATQLQRIFGSVHEKRRKCMACGFCTVRFEPGTGLQLPPREGRGRGGADTISEMYLRSCGPEVNDTPTDCARCGQRQVHVQQSRLRHAPRVLVVKVQRRPVEGFAPGAELGRVEVAVEEELELPGLPRMTLSGVVYHNGNTAQTGHYTCVCRGPEGRFRIFDDRRVSRLEGDVSTHKRTQVALAVYVRAGGEPWLRAPGGRAPDAGAGPSGSGAVPAERGAPGGVAGTPRRLRRKGRELFSPRASGRSGGGAASGAVVVSTPESGKKRMSVKTSAEAGGVATGGACAATGALGVATTPESAKKRLKGKTSAEVAEGLCAGTPRASVGAGGATPPASGKRRSGGNAKAEEVGDIPRWRGGEGCSTPDSGKRRLRRKTMEGVSGGAVDGESVVASAGVGTGPLLGAGAPCGQRLGGAALGASGSRVLPRPRGPSEGELARDLEARAVRQRGGKGRGGAAGGAASRGGGLPRRGVGAELGGDAGAAMESSVGSAVTGSERGSLGRAGPGGVGAAVRRSARLAGAATRAIGAAAAPNGGAAAAQEASAIVGGVIRRPVGARREGAGDDGVERARGRVVTGFGGDRIEDLAAHNRERSARDARVAAERVREGASGDQVDMWGAALDRSAGAAWHVGRGR